MHLRHKTSLVSLFKAANTFVNYSNHLLRNFTSSASNTLVLNKNPGYSKLDSGFRDQLQAQQMGPCAFVKNVDHKRKYHKPISDEKVHTIGAAKGSVSAEIAENDAVNKPAIKILSYNVWYRVSVEGNLRMQAIGDLIQLHSPDIICLQEVNFAIYTIFQTSSWWKKYRCSVLCETSQNKGIFCMQLAKLPVRFSYKPFSNTSTSRELCIAEVQVNENKQLVIATSHLENPCLGPPNWDKFTKERVDQAKEALTYLKRYENVIFGGDMSWDDEKDGQFPLTKGWFDAWEKLRPDEVGYTYDSRSNRMLSGNYTKRQRQRHDRFICHLPDFRVSNIEMIGTEAIPGVEYKTEKKAKGQVKELIRPVYPSDHYGLLLTITA